MKCISFKTLLIEIWCIQWTHFIKSDTFV